MWIWVSWLPTNQMNSLFSLLPLPGLEGRRMDSIGRRQRMFGEATSFGTSAASTDQEYSYKTDFEIWREN